jgi:dihydroneopterin aldolase
MIKTLGSIKNIDEAQALSSLSFDIVDIKNVDDGALGYVGNDQIELIARKIKNKDLSVTAGNDIHPNTLEVENKLKFLCSIGIKYMKIGIFNMNFLNQHKVFLKKVSAYNIKTVGVIFANKKLNTSDIKSIYELNYDGLMIDTIAKSRTSSLDILSNDFLKSFIRECRKEDKFCGISGSIGQANIEYAMQFESDFIGFRGALCLSSRREDIDIKKCNNLLTKVKDINQKMYQEAV